MTGTRIYFEVYQYMGNGQRQYVFRSYDYDKCEQHIKKIAPLDRFGYPILSQYEIHMEFDQD